jgi:hypothetical protein
MKEATRILFITFAQLYYTIDYRLYYQRQRRFFLENKLKDAYS